MRRYFIHRYHAVTWTLVFDAGPGRWHVEKAAAKSAPVRVSLEEFERSDFGRQLKDQLGLAVREAENDA